MRSTKTQHGPNKLVACLIVLAVMAGCASTKETNEQGYAGGQLPRPGQIWVYPFAATPTEVPPESALAGQTAQPPVPPTAQQIAEAQKLGSEIATEVVQQIVGMGMSGAVASAATRPQLNDLVIEGSLLSVQQGSADERVIVGFGAGGSEMKVAVEGFRMTPTGLRKLGSGDLNATGNKTPGSAVGLASLLATHNPAGFIVSTGMKLYGEKSGSDTVQGRAQQIAKQIGDQLKQRFQQQGWISGAS
jgi:Domain of unknown function (DUF4410)